MYRYVENDPVQYKDPYGENKFKEAWDRVKKCKKAVDNYLDEKTCESAKEINPNYECKEWPDNVGEIVDPRNWGSGNDDNGKK